ncbi:hypothetical protein FRC96_06790 [Lujinxingia vulgaris]|uniref:DUF697 domain-containing protein n=1 Tax=Lujinxingia vulgaris TaxID=2600176 RepID=A0A5C6XCD9_9DELT|nr:hypothetical protein [Lujinxingia vulgaris]TXD39627.1 hypothetical protein FRC96_06790 [Lujinxingia vulgaris]
MASKREKAHLIIHGAASAAGAVGAGMAQLPGSDNAIITPIQVGMIVALADVHGQKMEKAGALAVLSSLSAGIVGRTASQFLVGWIPGVGNAINAGTAFSITEAIGWAAYRYFDPDEG